MKYISIDIETTGLDRENDQVLEIGAIIEDTENPLPYDELPKYRAILLHERYSGSEYAIHLNQRIFKILAEQPRTSEDRLQYMVKHNIQDVNSVVVDFYYWCTKNLKTPIYGRKFGKIEAVVAGKNYTDFDKQFLHRLPEWDKYFYLNRRALDPGILFTNLIRDKQVPSLGVCLERAGIEDSVVTHDSVNDAWQVIQVLRTKY